MNADEQLAEVGRWLGYAQADLRAAEILIAGEDAIPRLSCWHAQQGAEKALKAVLVFLGIEVPRYHNLNALRNLILDGWQLKDDHPDLSRLTEWAVEARYPGDWPDATEADARLAVQEARALWNSVMADLTEHGLRVDASP